MSEATSIDAAIDAAIEQRGVLAYDGTTFDVLTADDSYDDLNVSETVSGATSTTSGVSRGASASTTPETDSGTSSNAPATSHEAIDLTLSEEDSSRTWNTPDVSLRASDLSIPEGGSVTLTWNASEANSCRASGGWSGQRSTSGAQVIGPVTAGTTYSLNCTGPGGAALKMISVAVVGPVSLAWVAPDENVDGSDLVDLAGYRLYYGESSRDYSDIVELTDTRATSHTLDLPTGSYYFAMTAFDTEGHESDYSNEVQRLRP